MNEDNSRQAAKGATGLSPLFPGLRGDAAAKAILLRLLEAIEANEAGVLLGEDPEALHDFRIAVRRTRSALGQIKGVFPPRTVSRFSANFAWLGQITGEPRDLDVYLLGFDALKAGLPAPFQDGIEPLRGFLARRAGLAHAGLARQLRGRRYRKLLADWRRFLLAPCPARPSAPRARTPVQRIASERLWKLFRRVLKEGRAIRPDTPAESIHELRKSCKKLRYLLEFFRPLYPPDETARIIKQLKKLQDYLGEFQDVHTRIDMLGRLGGEMRADASVPTGTLLALGVLLAVLDSRQLALRKAFPGHFDAFANAGNRARFRGLFKPVRAE
jgi:CHAD domain-containing protein